MMGKQPIEIFKAETGSELALPFADDGIKAGFPSPAQDYMDVFIDLNSELVKNPASTFYGRVSGWSMKDEGIDDGDILVIDKSLEVQNNDLVVCAIDGEFTLKRIDIDKDVIWLVPSNPDFPKIKVTPNDEFTVWGVVTHTVKSNRRKRR